MEFNDVVPFFETHKRGVIATRRPNGATHSSIVVCGAYEGNAAFVSVYPRSQKIRNLRRDPNCTVLSVRDDWREWVSVEGQATLIDYNTTDAEEMRAPAPQGVHGVQPHRASRLGGVRSGHGRPGGRDRPRQA